MENQSKVLFFSITLLLSTGVVSAAHDDGRAGMSISAAKAERRAERVSGARAIEQKASDDLRSTVIAVKESIADSESSLETSKDQLAKWTAAQAALAKAQADVKFAVGYDSDSDKPGCVVSGLISVKQAVVAHPVRTVFGVAAVAAGVYNRDAIVSAARRAKESIASKLTGAVTGDIVVSKK